MRIAAVDVGVTNLAVTWVHVDSNRSVVVEGTRRIDISILTHNRVTRPQCTLHHGNSATDRIEHFLQEHGEVLDRADVVLIEQQPPGGLAHVEQLLFSRYRNKAHLCSPVALHKWLGIGGLDYEARKAHTEARAAPYLGALKHYWLEERKHDMADALCMILHWVDTYIEPPPPPRPDADLDEWFNRFKYKKVA